MNHMKGSFSNFFPDTDEIFQVCLPLAQYSYNTMPRPRFQRMSSYKVLYGFRPQFDRFRRIRWSNVDR